MVISCPGWVTRRKTEPADAVLAQGALAAFSSEPRVQALVGQALQNEGTSAEVRRVLLAAVGRTTPLPQAWLKPLAKLVAEEMVTAGLCRNVINANSPARCIRYCKLVLSFTMVRPPRRMLRHFPVFVRLQCH